MSLLDILQGFIGFLIGSGVALVAVLLYFFKNPEKLEKWASIFFRVFASVSKNWEKRYMATNIQSVVDSRRKEIGLSERGLSYGIQIKWTNDDTIETDLDENNVVVMMRPFKSQAKNLANMISVYVPEALLPQSRRYVDQSLMKGIDSTVSKAILSVNPTALSYYVNTLMKLPEDTLRKMEQIEELNNIGYLTRIIIPEYEMLSGLYPAEPSNSVAKETIELFESASSYVRKVDADVSLSGEGIFMGNLLNMCIVPVGAADVLLTSGITKHCDFMKRWHSRGIRYFYIVSTEILTEHFEKLISKICQDLKLSVVFRETYKGTLRKKKRNLMCCLLVSRES
jgi:hypothetical protein